MPAAILLNLMNQQPALLDDSPSVLLQQVIVPGEKTAEGELILATAFPWFKILEMIFEKPHTIYELDWRRWEEIIAGAYVEQGFDVTLTPRSNDKGRDVIATWKGHGSIRIVDQVKAYKPGHLVTAEDVRAMVGVLTLSRNVSKGIVTTTSEFAPGIYKDQNIQSFVPYRLELRPKDQLIQWLHAAAASTPDSAN
jgi:restriction system protein